MSETELVVIEQSTALEVFSAGGTDAIVQKIREKVMNVVSDVSTAKGRSEIASRAQKVRSSKVYIDNARKDLKKDLKTQVDAIDGEGKVAREALEKLVIEVMEPLQAWRDAEAKRVKELGERLDKFTYTFELFQHQDIGGLENYLAWANSVEIDDSWQELKGKAVEAKPIFIEKLTARLNDLKAKEADRLKLIQLQKEADERKQKEREEKIAADAKAEAEAKTKAIEAKAKADAEKAEREKQEAIKREEAAKQAAIDAKKKAEADKIQAAKDAEARAKAASDKAEADKKQAAINAELAKEVAIEKERQRVADEQAAAEKAAAKKAANTAHQKKINRAALADFEKNGIDEATAKKVIEAIARKKISYITINY